MKKAIHILVIEDGAASSAMLNQLLRQGGLNFRSKRIKTQDAFLHELDHHPPDLILSNHGSSSLEGETALSLARIRCPDVPFIFVTGASEEQEALKVAPPNHNANVSMSNLTQLVPTVERLLRQAEERKQLKGIEPMLNLNSEPFRLLVQTVKDYAIYMLSPEGQVATWNAGAERLTGYRASDIIGKHFSVFFTPEDIQRGLPERMLRDAKDKGHAINEGWRIRRDRSQFWIQGTLTAMSDETGKFCGYAKVAHDMTEQKRAAEVVWLLKTDLEHRVLERTKQLESAIQELEAFSYSVSHDLRSPLRHIVGYVEILHNEAAEDLPSDARQHLQTIADSAKRMAELIDGLLAFSRMGRLEMHEDRVSLSSLVEEARQELRGDISGRSIDWHLGNLPFVHGDPFLLRSVFVHLLSNALKFTRTRAKARIEIGAQESDHEVVVSVRDNGLGFDMQYASRIFGLFQRLHRAEEFEGTGIGLASVRRIIHRHGGRVWAQGAIDAGATFCVALPKHTPAQPKTQVA